MPNGGPNRKAHISNTSLEVIKQKHRQIDSNQNQPKGIISQTNAPISKGLILSELTSKHTAKATAADTLK